MQIKLRLVNGEVISVDIGGMNYKELSQLVNELEKQYDYEELWVE